jgi:hypothetical protein
MAPQEFADAARRKSRRRLLIMLRATRRKPRRHVEARMEVAAVEAELRARGLAVPPEGQETAAWEKKAQQR